MKPAPPLRSTLAVLAAAAATLITGTGIAAEPPASAPPREESDASRAADELLERAQSAGEAAMAWLQRRTGVGKDDVAERAAAAEEALRRAVADAVERSGEGREPGVRLLAPGSAPGQTAWTALEDDAAAPALPEAMVLLVHGMDEPGGIWDDLAPALRGAGLEVARFDYPNDQPLATSAEMLAASLAELRARGVTRLDLVAHSAGGLVVRDVLTRPAPGMYGGEPRGHAALPGVARFIMLGTPNRGAALVRLRALAEAREQFVRWIDSDGKDPAALLGFLRDGGGEIADDLRPGSAYLTELNARPLPRSGEDGVRITAVVGTIGEEKSRSLSEALGSPVVRRALTEEQVRDAQAGLLELGETLGDGLVPVSSQLLEGVGDVVYVRANHRSMIRRLALPGAPASLRLENGTPPAVGAVVERLAR